MTSNHFSPSETPQDGMPACIWVEVGPLKLPAILSSSSWLSLMPLEVYDKIRKIPRDQNLITKEHSIDDEDLIDGCGGTQGILKRIQLNASIERQVVPIEVSVVGNLVTDLVLGGQFIYSVKGTFHFGVGVFKWQYQNTIIISNFITKWEELSVRCMNNPAVNGSTTNKATSSSTSKRKRRNLSTSDEDESTCWGCELQAALMSSDDDESGCWGCDFEAALLTMTFQGKFAQKASEKKSATKASSSKTQTRNKTQKDTKKTDDDFYSLLKNCFLNDSKPKPTKKINAAGDAKPPSQSKPLNSPTECSSSAKLSQVSQNPTNMPDSADKKWKSVYVMTKEMHEILGGSPMAYNGIFWSRRNKLNLVFGEELDDKSGGGFHLIAIAKLLQVAHDNKWSSLRVVSNNALVTHLLQSYLITGRLGSREDLHFFSKADYKAYEFTCKYLNVMGPIKFESVDPSEVSEMRTLERIIDAYIFNSSSY